MQAICLLFLTVIVTFCFGADFFEDTGAIRWVKCKADEKYTKASNLDQKWYDEHSKAGWYYVMGNKWHILTLHRALKGKEDDAKNIHDIAEACFTNQRKDVNGKKGFIISGYGGKHAAYKCDSKMGDREECTPTHDSTSEVNAAFRGTTESVVVWTDNKKYVLGYRCSAQTKVWSVRSTENKKIDAATKKIIMEKITADGFNPLNAVDIPREGCPTIESSH